MASESKHTDQLITRYLTGEATEDERLQLNNWLYESEVNQKYFDQIKFIHDKASRTYPEINFDVDKAWERVKSQMKHTPKIEIKSQKQQFGWLKIAALVVAIIGISTVIYLTTREPSTSKFIKTQLVAVVSVDSAINKKLPDNTEVYLNKKSKIAYSQDYGKKNREVTLEGEAYFNATHSVDKPLTVKAENTFIKDIGTAFNIKAYPGESEIEVYVENGKVVFYSQADSGLTLVQGDVGIYNKKTNTFSKKQATANILAYKTKSFTFINAKLSDVILQLNSVYSTPLILKNSELSSCTITVSFKNEDLETITTIISETLDLKVSKTSEGYVFDGVKCNNP